MGGYLWLITVGAIMGSSQFVRIGLQLTHANLVSLNPTLISGQLVTVTDIPNAILPAHKIGNGTTAYNSLPFIDTIKIQIDANYDMTQSFLTINGNDIEITNTGTVTRTLTTDTGTIALVSLATMRFRRIGGAWLRIDVALQLTAFGQDVIETADADEALALLVPSSLTETTKTNVRDNISVYSKQQAKVRTEITADTTVAIAADETYRMLVLTTAGWSTNTVTLNIASGVNELTEIEIVNISGSQKLITDGTTSYYLANESRFKVYKSGGTLRRTARHMLNGLLDPRDKINGTLNVLNITEATMWTTFAPFIPNVGDKIYLNGQVNVAAPNGCFWLERTATDVITIQWGALAATAGTPQTIKADGSGTFVDTNDITLTW